MTVYGCTRWLYAGGAFAFIVAGVWDAAYGRWWFAAADAAMAAVTATLGWLLRRVKRPIR